MRWTPPSKAGLAAAVLSGAVAVLYLSLIAQGAVGADEGDRPRVALFAALFVALPVCAAFGALRPASNVGVSLLIVAASGMTVLGILGLLSIGLPLLLAGGLAWAAVIRTARGRGA